MRPDIRSCPERKGVQRPLDELDEWFLDRVLARAAKHCVLEDVGDAGILRLVRLPVKATAVCLAVKPVEEPDAGDVASPGRGSVEILRTPVVLRTAYKLVKWSVRT